MVIRQGDVFWVDLGDPSGSGPGYRHPYVVVQNNVFNRSRINTVVVCALTSNLRRAEAPGNVLLEAGEANLPRPSVVTVSQMYTVDKRDLTEYLGLVCRADSSPVMYKTRKSSRASAAASCSSRVDLPMPGSPPNNTSDPGTSPPPSTRFSSLLEQRMRARSSCEISRNGSGWLRTAGAARTPRFAGAATRSSTSVFHCSHSGQRPSQRKLLWPQFWQTYCRLSFLRRVMRCWRPCSTH